MPPRLKLVPVAVMSEVISHFNEDDETTTYKVKIIVIGEEKVQDFDVYINPELWVKRWELFRPGHHLWLQGVVNEASILVIDAWYMREPLDM